MANIYGEKNNLRVQWEKIKDGTPQEKFDWFVTYFGLYTVIGLALLALVIFLIVSAVKSNKPKVISALFLDIPASEEGVEELRLSMCEWMGVKESGYGIDAGFLYSDTGDVSNLYAQQQSVFARVAAKELDVIALPEENVSVYLDGESPEFSCFDPLGNVLSAGIIKRLEKSGRLVSRDIQGKATPYFVQAAHSPLSELLGVSGDDFLIGISATAKSPEQIEILMEIILD